MPALLFFFALLFYLGAPLSAETHLQRYRELQALSIQGQKQSAELMASLKRSEMLLEKQKQERMSERQLLQKSLDTVSSELEVSTALLNESKSSLERALKNATDAEKRIAKVEKDKQKQERRAAILAVLSLIEACLLVGFVAYLKLTPYLKRIGQFVHPP